MISFPRELPDVEYANVNLTLVGDTKASASGAMLINYTETSDPMWQADLTTGLLLPSQCAAVEAWWFSLREGLRTAIFRHPWSCYPVAHVKNQAPADDAGNLVSVADGNILSVNGIDPALTLNAGDKVGLEMSGRYYLGRISEASGSGTARSITVEPPPFDSVKQAGAVVRFARPGIIMRAVPGSFQAPRSGRYYTASFQLRESL